MTNHEYLQAIAKDQEVSSQQLDVLRRVREGIEGELRRLSGNPSFYYAGSFAKKTMVREMFDLDIVVYWPHGWNDTLRNISDAVGNVLRQKWQSVAPKTVAWTINFQGGFHVDVVPGRAIDNSFLYANLYRRDRDSSLKTSIKVHIDTVRNSGRRDAIRLMKLWRLRKRVPWKTTLALELATIEGAKGSSATDLEKQLLQVFSYLRDNITTVRLVDPANTNNVLSDELTAGDRSSIKSASQAALDAKTWDEVFRQQ
jgi:hypothetical protein